MCKCDCETILDNQTKSQPFQTLSFCVGWIQVQFLQRRTFLFLSGEEYAQMLSFWEPIWKEGLRPVAPQAPLHRIPLFSA